ncbi:hypothetical protein T492DRAFT_1090490 [Pavlovales sp. CCMP2436]|nr:hypothetical protein T492DRAFT_1090490 [Pavlovales sp. CCMP2436]
MLGARRATLQVVLRPFALGLGGSALYATFDAFVPAQPRDEASRPAPPIPSLAMAAVTVAASAPLFGISILGMAGAVRGHGGLKWLSRNWEHIGWTAFFSSTAVLAVARPTPMVVAASPMADRHGATVAAAEMATRLCTVSAGASLVGVLAGERLGSYFGAALILPALVGSVWTAALLPDMPLASFAPAPALVIPFLLLASPPVFSRSLDLLTVGLWATCAALPALSEYFMPAGEDPANRPADLLGNDRRSAQLAFEQLMAGMALFGLHRYLLRRRPLCQY